MAANTLNVCGVLSETKRIINAHSSHFLALSVIFLLPLSFSLVVYPFLSHSPSTLSHFRDSLFFFSTPPSSETPPPNPPILLPILHGCFVLLFSLCAAASITHSTFHGFYGRPVKFTSSIKSVLFSSLPLTATLIIAQLIIALFVFVFGGFTALVYNGFAELGFEIDYSNIYFTGFVILICLGLLIYLQVEWYLSTVIVVVESNWGLSALRRSSYLVKGMRGIAFSMIIVFGLLIGFLGNLCANLMPDSIEINRGWVSLAFVFQTVVYTGFMTILMLYNVAANAVLYMYCKALRGELAFEIAEEFASEYVRLPFDEGKVPHVVYVV